MVTLPRIIFLCLCTGGFCCNSGWYSYNGKCYKPSQHMYSNTMAKRFCQVLNAHLAYVNSTDILQFINTMPNFRITGERQTNQMHKHFSTLLESVKKDQGIYLNDQITKDGANEYWIHQTSSIQQTTSSTSPTFYETTEHSEDHEHGNHSTVSPVIPSGLCTYMKVLKIDLEFCRVKKFFVCESLYPDAPSICPTGFDYYGTHCYRAISSVKANYEEAEKFCMMQNSKLAMLESEDEEWEAKSIMLGKNETFLVGAKKKDGVIKWDNGVIFSPLHDMFGNYSEGDCVGFLSEPEHPLVFVWSHVKCEEKNSFLCETDTEQTNKTETTTAEPGTTLPPLECPHGYNWKSHDISGNCFWETTYETERLNWFQARSFCKLYGGDLASYESAEQEKIGLGGAHGHYRGLWIGLQRDQNSVFHWVDGTIFNYSNWAVNEPNLNSNSKFCVTHSSISSEWALDYCGVRRWFICKAPKVRNPVVPELPSPKRTRCDIQGTSAYRTQWYEFEGHCYLIIDSARYTWDTARFACQDNDAHMASIHSFDETNFILASMSTYPDSDYWIGLNAHGLHSSYEWTDATPLDFIYWADNKTEPKELNTCVHFNKRDGSWDIDNCNRLQGVICKRGINASYDFTSTEPTTVMPGNCENGWYNLGNKCYKFFGNLWSQRVTWSQAKSECDTLGASLVSIHNRDEQDFLTDIVLEAYTDVWIGLRAIESGTIFHWSDDSRMDFTNWNANEPEFHSDTHQFPYRNPVELCVQMEYGENVMGKWNDINCEDKKGYVCQKYKDPSNVGPYQDPFNCPNMTDWYRLGTACYGFFQEKNSTWLEAQGECRKYGANLITYRNMAVSIFVKRKLKQKATHFWIGIREKVPDKYEYVTGHPLFYANWMVGQPQAASSILDNCAATTTDGEWLVKSCKEKHPFICKLSLDSDPEPEIDRAHTCKNLTGDWNDFGGNYCYMYETGLRLSWVDAMHFCFRHGGYLASFHSVDEINKVRRIVLYFNKPPSLHIGLGKKKDGSYAWVDNSPVDFTYWDEDEPSGIDRECVELNMRSGKWNTVDCDDSFRGFVCSSPKMSMYFDDVPPLNATSEKEIISRKLTVGGIFGIIICFVVILTIIGVTWYYLRPTKQIQPRLLETDNL